MPLMAQCQHHDAVDMRQKPVERQVTGSPSRNHQFALPEVDFAANLGVPDQNLEPVKNQGGGTFRCLRVGLQQEVAQPLQVDQCLLGVNQFSHPTRLAAWPPPAAAPAAGSACPPLREPGHRL